MVGALVALYVFGSMHIFVTPASEPKIAALQPGRALGVTVPAQAPIRTIAHVRLQDPPQIFAPRGRCLRRYVFHSSWITLNRSEMEWLGQVMPRW